MAKIDLGMLSGPSKPVGCIGRAFSTLFFLVFAGMGSLFVVFMLREAWTAGRMLAWDKVPCTILESRVINDEKNQNYRFIVRYRYDVKGQKRESSGYRRGYDGSDDYADAQELADRFPVEAAATCYVNPVDAGETWLVPPSAWVALAIPFPLIFVTIGLGGIWYTWRKGADREKPLSSRATTGNPRTGRYIGTGVCAVFVLIGGGMMIFWIGPAVVNTLAAKAWKPVPCTVLSSRVKSHSSDDGTTYSVDVFYQYEVDGQTYRSNRIGFLRGSSSGYESKKQQVDQYPVGSKRTCYVNPGNPRQAVLDRDFSAWMLIGLLPLGFLVIGFLGMFGLLRGMPAKGAGPGGVIPEPTKAMKLKSSSPIAKLIGITFFSLFWNGIVSVFVWQAVQSWQRGSPDWCLTVFMIPFVAVGIGTIGGIGYYTLALFNPRLKLDLERHPLRLGQEGRMNWELTGRYDCVTKLTITLEGTEEATYRRGTSTSTDKNVFHKTPVTEKNRDYEVRRGRASFVIPADSMHTFSAPNNKIVWRLKVRGEIPRWPDVIEEYEVTVLPHSIEGDQR